MLSVGGLSTDSLETLTNYVDMVAIWGHNVANSDGGVGQKQANGYGIYDTVGLAFEWVADYYKNVLSNYTGVNPVGPTEGDSNGTRLRRSMHGSYPSSSSAQNLHYYTPSYSGNQKPSGDDYGYRLCIHLNSLFK
jgi:formylglycine-generating enzyme required for sulfatase activity